jgi:hypothetical protein
VNLHSKRGIYNINKIDSIVFKQMTTPHTISMDELPHGRSDTIYYLNIFTATIHLISGVTIRIIADQLDPTPPIVPRDNTATPYLPAVCFDLDDDEGRPQFQIEPQSVAETRPYLTALVVTFFFLSAGFQYAQSWEKDKYIRRVTTNDVNILRYVEYSLSASVMMVLIACAVSVYDVFTHILIFTCTFLCMMLGLVADFIRVLRRTMHSVLEPDDGEQDEKDGQESQVFFGPELSRLSTDQRDHLTECIRDGGRLMWGLHFMGWVAIMVPYLAVFMVAYFNTGYRGWECLEKVGDDVEMVPWPITLIIISQFFLFSSFGVVQLVQFYASWRDGPRTAEYREKIGINTEMAFIILSLTAKSLLGWVAATQIIFA